MIGQLLIASAAVIVAVLGVTFFVGERLGRHNVVDVAWGLSFVGIAVVTAVIGNGDPTRRLLLAGLVSIWGLRLATHLAIRSRGQGEDPRYVALLAKSNQPRVVAVITRIYLLQGVLIWFISLPVQLSAASTDATRWVALMIIGIGIWCVGIFFEAVGDAQLHAFKRDPAHRGVVITTGLWRYTRHPNYFGDACVWWGLFAVALSAGPVILFTIASPVVVTVLLTRVSGKALLERQLKDRPGYADYVRCTSGFIPLPPRR